MRQTVVLECPECGNRYIAPEGSDGWCVGPEKRRHKPKVFKIVKEAA